MKWEDLKVYKSLNKEELKIAKKEIENIISEQLLQFGFKKYGRKLIRKSEDLFHIIHLDSRGSWMGNSNSLKTEIMIVSIYDVDIIVKNYEMPPKIYIQDIVPKIRNYYQITQEYKLFAEFISQNLINYVIPYLNQFTNSKSVLKNFSKLKLENPEIKNLVIYSELSNQIDNYSTKFLEEKTKNLNDKDELYSLKNFVEKREWKKITELLENNKNEIFKKLKIG